MLRLEVLEGLLVRVEVPQVAAVLLAEEGRPGPGRERGRRQFFGKMLAKCCSFSAVSAPIFAKKVAFCSIFQNLPDYQAEIFEI